MSSSILTYAKSIHNHYIGCKINNSALYNRIVGHQRREMLMATCKLIPTGFPTESSISLTMYVSCISHTILCTNHLQISFFFFLTDTLKRSQIRDLRRYNNYRSQ